MNKKVKLKPLKAPVHPKTIFNSVDYTIPPKKVYKVQTGDVINRFVNNNVKDVRVKTTKATHRKKTIPTVHHETDLFSLMNKISPRKSKTHKITP